MPPRAIVSRLCLMMFLEYSVRGMWYPYLANYLTAPRSMNGLGFSPGQTGWILGFANAVGAVTAPFIAGQVADRYLNAERALALLHLAAAALLFLNASTTTFWPFFLCMVAFSVAYVPTMSLTNSLSLTHLTDREHSYPRVRMWGTIGWVVTSALFTYVVLTAPDRATNVARIPHALRTAAALAVAYAAYAFFLLPKTPPAQRTSPAGAPHSPPGAGDPPASDRRGLRHTPAWRAFSLLRDRSVLVLVLVALPVAAIHTAYYLNIGPFLASVVGVPERLIGPTLAISQVSEVFFLFTLGPMLRRFGYTTLLTVGAAAQAARFIVFAVDPPAPFVIAALAFHGVAFACFFTTAVLYIERAAPADIRHSAQTVFGIVLFGLGPALAGPYSELFDRFRLVTPAGPVPDFRLIWWTQALVATASALAILVLFRPMASRRETAPAP